MRIAALRFLALCPGQAARASRVSASSLHNEGSDGTRRRDCWADRVCDSGDRGQRCYMRRVPQGTLAPAHQAAGASTPDEDGLHSSVTHSRHPEMTKSVLGATLFAVTIMKAL